MTTKPWYQSKTLLVNALILLAFALDQITHTVSLTPEQAAWVAVAVAVLNMALRMATSTALTPPGA